jgi:creatinine amidohydrolase
MRWQEMSSVQVDALDRDGTIVILPLGSVEQHGRHMPLGTDTILAEAVALAAAERLNGRAAVLPPPWYGLSDHHMRFAGSVTLSARTMLALVEDIAASVVTHGFSRLLVVNGHGGNNGIIDVLAGQLGHRFYGQARIACVTYFQLAKAAIAALRRSRPGGMGHAGEFETSMMLHLRPELVALEEAQVMYPDTGSEYLTTDLLGSSRARAHHDFADLSPSGTLGDPSLADGERGGAFHEAVVKELVLFIEDFGRWPIHTSAPASPAAK